MSATHRSLAASPPSPLLANGDPKVQGFDQPKFLPHWDQTDLCASPGNVGYMLTPRKRRKDESFSTTLRSWVVDHQIGLSINLLLLLALVHICFPRARRRTSTFFTLSYYNPSSDSYMRGPDDFYFVACWIIIFTGLRAATLQYVLLPYAQWCGLEKPKTRVRFAEQGWVWLYDTSSWSLGMYILATSKYFNNFSELWTDFPVLEMTFSMKWYYLVQFAFWLQQIVVVNIEERRKDHWQMFTHHIVTSFLVLFSYGYYQQRAGNVILVLMDVVDICLPAAKMLRYTGYQTVCDIVFGIFILTWIIARHIIYSVVLWSIYVGPPSIMTPGCYSSITGSLLSSPSPATPPASGSLPNPKYDPDFATRFGDLGTTDMLSNVMQPYLNPGGTVCYFERMSNIFFVLLLSLQVIMLVWLALIIRIAWRVVAGSGADDERSDDEDEEETEEVVENTIEAAPASASAHGLETVLPPSAVPLTMRPIEVEAPLEEYVGVEGLNLKSRGVSRAGSSSRGMRNATRSKKSATSTGSSFMGHSDRKELLGRIGCDKPVADDDED